MRKHIAKQSYTRREQGPDGHRFEHWYVDNQMYFMTARVRDQFPALAGDQAKRIFFDRLEHHAGQAGFALWIVSVLDNHYHLIGYNRIGAALKTMMQRVHGSVAKLANDLLPQRYPNFWRDKKGREYFDGCLRDEKQCRLAWRYTLKQGERHGIVTDYCDYPFTKIYLDLDRAIARSHELQAFMENVPYLRYQKHRVHHA